MALTQKEHKKRHEELHKALDELVADWIQCVPGALPSQATVMDLIKWSHEQTEEATICQPG